MRRFGEELLENGSDGGADSADCGTACRFRDFLRRCGQWSDGFVFLWGRGCGFDCGFYVHPPHLLGLRVEGPCLLRLRLCLNFHHWLCFFLLLFHGNRHYRLCFFVLRFGVNFHHRLRLFVLRLCLKCHGRLRLFRLRFYLNFHHRLLLSLLSFCGN